MSLWQTIHQWFVHPATPFYYGRIDDSRTPGVPAGVPVQEGEAYLRLWLVQMYLQNDRTWFQGWYPVTHALVKLRFADQELTVPYIAGPDSLKGLDENHLNRVIQMNHQLTGLLPYNGGSIELQTGLLAMKGDNQLSTALKVVSDMSALLAVPQLSSVLSIALPLANGVQGMLTSATGGLQLGLQQTFTTAAGGSNTLRPGYFMAAAAPEAEVSPKNLWVVDDVLRVGASESSSTPYTGASFMLFRLEVSTEHDNYRGFTSIEQKMKLAEKALFDGNADDALLNLRSACLEAWQSPDLTTADRRRLIMALKKRFEEAKGLGPAGFGAVGDEPSMEERVRLAGTATETMTVPFAKLIP